MRLSFVNVTTFSAEYYVNHIIFIENDSKEICYQNGHSVHIKVEKVETTSGAGVI